MLFLHIRQKGTRAAGWDTDCSGIRPGQFSDQLHAFPLLRVILLRAVELWSTMAEIVKDRFQKAFIVP